ncbi:hypothetical protein [Thalassobacillus devorans]|uniref:hypothetical protein n=1 Tax=Thalassobacillus devorans TaxID=279813 RepID=UPI0020CB5C38|nr:hypothetical protein [Thalassobacillus devorans]
MIGRIAGQFVLLIFRRVVVKMKANKKWVALPKDIRNKLIQNVFCPHCLDTVTIVEFVIVDDPAGILLEGKCKNCRNEVARVVEVDE